MESYINPKHTALGSVFNGCASEIHQNAVDHGFYDDFDNLCDSLASRGNDFDSIANFLGIAKRDFVLSQLAKIAGEVGEAVSAIQHNDTDNLYEELADIVIRTFDLSEFVGCQIGDCILRKMEVNRNRPYKHGKVC